MTQVWVAGLSALIVAAVLTPACKRIAARIGAVATPKADRWHRTSIPMLGGVAVAAATLLTAAASAPHRLEVWLLLGAAGALGVVGLVDDVRPLRPQAKLIAQIVVAAAVVAFGLQLRLTPYPILNSLLSLAWLVGLTNAFNLLDNMDGLSAGVAAIATAFRLTFFLLDGNSEGAMLAAGFLGALLGFLIYNVNPASIFMGDAGSLFIGFFVAGLSLIEGYAYSRGTMSVVLFPVLMLLVPIFDTAFVTITRLLGGRKVSVGGRDHTSHRLVALGLSERRAVLLLCGLSLTSGLVAFLHYQSGLSYSAVIVVFLALGVAVLGVLLARVEVGASDAAPADGFVRLVADFSYKRQVVTVLLDLVWIVLAYYSAYLIRFEQDFSSYERVFAQSLPIVIAAQLAALAGFRVYQGMWRYTSLQDVIGLAKASSVGSALAVVALVFAYRFEGYSRSVFVLDWMLLLGMLAGSRASLRVIAELLRPRPDGRRVLIYGAGDGGAATLRELLQNHALGFAPVGFLDDDRSKRRTKIHGFPVFGGLDRLEAILDEQHVADVVVASSKISTARMEQIAERCKPRGVGVLRASMQLESVSTERRDAS